MSAPDVATKHCGGCDRDLPADLDHFHRRKASKDGLQAKCRDCQRMRVRSTAAMQSRAYGRASARLRQLFRPDFDRLYAEELERERAL